MISNFMSSFTFFVLMLRLASCTDASENTWCCNSTKCTPNVPQQHVMKAGNENKISLLLVKIVQEKNTFPSCSKDDEDFLNKILFLNIPF